MNINKNNYEAFFLDYHEGNLSAEEVADVLLFVEVNPELKEAFESFESIAIDGVEANEFKNKTSLKKVVLSANTGSEYVLSELDYLLISSLEKTCTASESKQLKLLLKENRILTNDANLYAQTVLKPNTEIVFEGKEQLKKKKAVLIPFYYSIAIAASIALIVGIFYFNQISTPESNIIVQTNKSLINKPTQATPAENKTAFLATKKNNKNIHKNCIAINSITIKINKYNSTIKQEPLLANTPDTTTTFVKTEEKSVLQVIESAVDTSTSFTKNYAEIKAKIQVDEFPENNNQYLSIKELATQKIKESVLENKTQIQEIKKATKKLNGWDIAQFVTKGITKITGKEIVELTPHYNDDGSVISYALKAGTFEVSKEL